MPESQIKRLFSHTRLRWFLLGAATVSIAEFILPVVGKTPQIIHSYSSKPTTTAHSVLTQFDLNSLLSTATGAESAHAEETIDSVLARLSASSTYAGLPVRSVTVHVPTETQGIAILIPQIHRYPGSAYADSVNDMAETAQNEIYTIEKSVAGSNNIQFLMTEGDNYGLVPNAKIQLLQDKIKTTNELQTELDNVPTTDAAGALLKSNGEKVVALMQREISLAGGSYKLKAEKPTLTLYGSENPDTVAQSADIVRNYMYIEDRLASLTTPQSSNSTLSVSKNNLNLNSILGLIQSFTNDPGNALLQACRGIISKAQGTTDGPLVHSAQSIQATYKRLAELDNTVIETTVTTAPSRTDNPYTTVTNVKMLEDKKAIVEKQITDVVINERNAETTENFARGLVNTDNTVGIIQYGAGHEAGLTAEMNKHHIAVIVVTPTSVTGGENAAMPD